MITLTWPFRLSFPTAQNFCVIYTFISDIISKPSGDYTSSPPSSPKPSVVDYVRLKAYLIWCWKWGICSLAWSSFRIDWFFFFKQKNKNKNYAIACFVRRLGNIKVLFHWRLNRVGTKKKKKNQCLLHKNKIIMGLNYFGTTFCVLDHLSYVSSVGKSWENQLTCTKLECCHIFLSDTIEFGE